MEKLIRMLDYPDTPFVLNIGDYNVLVNSNCIFAGKFGTSLPEEKELVDKIFDMYK